MCFAFVHLKKDCSFVFLHYLPNSQSHVLLVLCVHCVVSVVPGYIYWLYILVMSVCGFWRLGLCWAHCVFFPSKPHLGSLHCLYCQACSLTSCHQNACLTFPVSDHFIDHSTNLQTFFVFNQLFNSVFFISCQQCGFFNHAKYEDTVPRYHAVRIRKAPRQFKDGKIQLSPFEKKQWMTTWTDNESYS